MHSNFKGQTYQGLQCFSYDHRPCLHPSLSSQSSLSPVGVDRDHDLDAGGRDACMDSGQAARGQGPPVPSQAVMQNLFLFALPSGHIRVPRSARLDDVDVKTFELVVSVLFFSSDINRGLYISLIFIIPQLTQGNYITCIMNRGNHNAAMQSSG